MGIANNLVKADEIIITPSAWRLIRNDCNAEVVEFELKESIAQGGRLKSLNKPSSIFAMPPPGHSRWRGKFIASLYPGAIINRLTAGQSGWIAELRRVTVLFINLPDIDQKTELAEAQNLARLVQRSVYRYEGSINKINVDDKGITLVAALGLPPFAHEDDPARGVQAALMIRKELAGLKVRSFIGITTGRIFCGSIGNDSRREYTTIGNAVNLSARLMGAAVKQDELIAKYGIPILCDRVTYDAAKDAAEFEISSASADQGAGRAGRGFPSDRPEEEHHPSQNGVDRPPGRESHDRQRLAGTCARRAASDAGPSGRGRHRQVAPVRRPCAPGGDPARAHVHRRRRPHREDELVSRLAPHLL
ncbi:MAG: adenylate/guanylate cyclase domain-containing protein [Bacillus subtilis]|nr:adenylate/guanylate cyclase domain-containing protein [Bacillus subtilis]